MVAVWFAIVSLGLARFAEREAVGSREVTLGASQTRWFAGALVNRYAGLRASHIPD